MPEHPSAVRAFGGCALQRRPPHAAATDAQEFYEMIFAIVGFVKSHIEAEAARVAPEVNEFLGQWNIRPAAAGPLRSKAGDKIGHLILLEAESFEAAEQYLERDPYFRDGLYARTQIAEFEIEVGALTRAAQGAAG
jgi:uncharacterized protein YciI